MRKEKSYYCLPPSLFKKKKEIKIKRFSVFIFPFVLLFFFFYDTSFRSR